MTSVRADNAMSTHKILSEIPTMKLTADHYEYGMQLLKQLHIDGLEHRGEQFDAAHERTYR